MTSLSKNVCVDKLLQEIVKGYNYTTDQNKAYWY